jgi:hypothetical protein
VTAPALNHEFHLRDSNCSNPRGSEVAPRHRWCVMKEGFSEGLLEAALADYSCDSEDLIIDPFCGSGTVPLASVQKGHKTLGIEVNPYLAFVARTKLMQCKPAQIERALARVLRGVDAGRTSPLQAFSTFSETGKNGKWLFNKSVLRAFEGGWQATNTLRPPVRDLLRLALVGAAMDSCNAVADGKCLRYRADWKEHPKRSKDFIESFERRVGLIANDMKEVPVTAESSEIIAGDARSILRTIREGFRLCVTSPPYLNSFDYTDVYRPQLFLSKLVTSSEELRALRCLTIRSHVQTSWRPPSRNAFGSLYRDTMSLIEGVREKLWDKRLPVMIQAYFEDMEAILSRLRTLALRGAALWLVVSTSAYAGVEVPVDLILAEIGTNVGWELREVGVLRYLRSSGQHVLTLAEDNSGVPRLRESVIILEAPSARCRHY